MELWKFMLVQEAGERIGWWQSSEDQTGMKVTVQEVMDTVEYIDDNYQAANFKMAVTQWAKDTKMNYM